MVNFSILHNFVFFDGFFALNPIFVLVNLVLFCNLCPFMMALMMIVIHNFVQLLYPAFLNHGSEEFFFFRGPKHSFRKEFFKNVMSLDRLKTFECDIVVGLSFFITGQSIICFINLKEYLLGILIFRISLRMVFQS